jgi:hypothetical protein
MEGIGCEIAVKNMIAFGKHFIKHKTMTNKQFFELQKEVFKKICKERGLKYEGSN